MTRSAQVRFSIPQDHDVWAIVPVAFSLTFEGPPEALVVLEPRIEDGHVWGNIRVPDDKLGEEVHNPSFQHGDVRFLEGMLPPGVVVVASKPVGLLFNYTMERHK